MRKKIVIMLMVFIPALFIIIGMQHRVYIKFMLKKQPFAYKAVRAGKNLINENIIAVFSKEKKRIKAKNVDIVVDAANVIENYEKFWGGFGHDCFYSGVTDPKYRAFFDLIKQINWTRKAFTYYRSHNIFSDLDAPSGEECGGNVYREEKNGNPVYDWSRINEVFDTILEVNMDPMVEFGFMPIDLTSDPDRIGNWRKANVAPPRDYAKWRTLVSETVRHLKDRYGEQEISKWYFEVWNEPDLWYHFWVPNPKDSSKTDVAEYNKLYDFTVAGAASVFPEIKIGGPAIAGWPYVLNGFLKHTQSGENYVTGQRGSKINFYSFHKYGDIEDKILKYTKIYVENALFINKEKFSSVPFFIDETGPSGTRWKNPWKNSPYISAWLCKLVDGMFELGIEKGRAYRPKGVVYWSDIGEDFKAGSSALATVLNDNTEYILKGPVFNAYEMLSYLGEKRVALEGAQFGDYVRGFATKTENESVEIVLYHIDKQYLNSDEVKDSVLVDLKVKNLPHQKYFLNLFKIDDNHSNGYGLWKRMGRPLKPTKGQFEILSQNDDLTLAEPAEQVGIDQYTFERTVALEANSSALLKLTRVTDNVPPLMPKNSRTVKNTTRSIWLDWQPPNIAPDGDRASSYLIFRNGERLGMSFHPELNDENLLDNTAYHYEIFSVDDQGNLSERALTATYTTKVDDQPPHVESFYMKNATTLYLYFNELIDTSLIATPSAFSINNNVHVNSIFWDKERKLLLLATSPHERGQKYVLDLSNVRDLAKKPNRVLTPQWSYRYILNYVDFFETKSIPRYLWSHNPPNAKTTAFTFDKSEERLIVQTGDDVSGSFSHLLPMSSSGLFKVTFLPFQKYPEGGAIEIKLLADEQNYISVSNTDGYGPGKVEKVASGQMVNFSNFRYSFRQGNLYRITIKFSPDEIVVHAFDQQVRLKNSPDQQKIQKFEITLSQQDAYIDDIIYEAE